MNQQDSNERSDVAVVVTTRNSSATIEHCLKSVFAQTVPVDVVVVDNHSNDDTAEIARRMGCRVVIAGWERSRQRNIGVGSTSTTWVLIVDSDMVLHEKTVASCLDACLDRGSSNCAAIVPQFAEGEGFLSRARSLEKLIYQGDELLEAPRFFHRSLFVGIGGYDEDLHAAEDWDLALRARQAGAAFCRATHGMTHLDGRMRLRDVFRKMRYYAPSLLAYKRKHPGFARKQMTPIRGALFRGLPMLLTHPLLAAGLVLLKFTEYAGFLIGSRRSRREESSSYHSKAGTDGHRGPTRCLLLSPATRWGSWSWFERIMDEAPKDVEWIVVSYGRPQNRRENVRYICLPSLNYAKYGLIMSRPRLLIGNLIYYLPLIPISWLAGLFFRPHVLVGNGVLATALLSPLKILGRPLFLAFHGYTGHAGRLWDRLIRYFGSKVDRAFVNSQTSLNDLARTIDPEKLVLVPHWAESRFFSLSLDRASRQRLRVLFVGRLDPEKFSQCMRVMQILGREGVAELWAVGRGSAEPEIAAAEGLHSLGYIEDRKTLAHTFEQCDVLWAPADATYLSLPGVEALAAGCPVIVSDIPAVEVRAGTGLRIPRDLVPPGLGFVVDGTHDAEPLRILRALAESGISEEMRKECRAFALKHHSPLNAQLVVSELFPNKTRASRYEKTVARGEGQESKLGEFGSVAEYAKADN